MVTKTHDGGLRDMRRDRKEVWIHPNLVNPARCYVRLIDKYLGLCPPFYKKANFYLQCRNIPTPACWYQNQVMGEGSIGKIISKLMESAGYLGFYSGHSLRRSVAVVYSKRGYSENSSKSVRDMPLTLLISTKLPAKIKGKPLVKFW